MRTFLIFSVALLGWLSRAGAFELPEPAAAWDCRWPEKARLGDEVALARDVFIGYGTDPALQKLRLLAPTNPNWGSECQAFWIKADAGRQALCLAPYAHPSIWAPAWRAAVLQLGETPGSFAETKALTIGLRFRLTDGFIHGGGNPPWELDGVLLRLPGALELGVLGRGQSHLRPRRPFLRVQADNQKATYLAESGSEIAPGRWVTLAAVFDSAAGRTELWLDGQKLDLRLESSPLKAGDALRATGPAWIGGDRSYNNCPLELDGYSLYSQALPAEGLAALFARPENPAPTPLEAARDFQPFTTLANLNSPDAWVCEGPGLSLAADGGALKAVLAQEAFDTSPAMRLKEPIDLTAAESVNFWYCLEARGFHYYHQFDLILADAQGKELDAKIVANRHMPGALDQHIGPPNSRACGLWKYVFSSVPAAKGAAQWKGIRFVTNKNRGFKQPGELYFRDFGVERIDYRQAKLYYVVGNYRDNFACTGFNGAGARALTEFQTGRDLPFVRLDNLVDQAKHGRPQRLDLRWFAYDQNDRLLYQETLTDLPAATVPDAGRPIPVPLTEPGTYRLKGKSYDHATGEYFTTDWTMLIVIKGDGQKPPAPAAAAEPLSVNAACPFGRLERDAPREIVFGVNLEAGYPFELRYQVQPYDDPPPGWQTFTPLKAGFETLNVTGPGELRAPYAPHQALELVVAELWREGKRIERTARPIGIRNDLPQAPAFTSEKNIPTLADLTSGDQIWFNSQIHDLRQNEAEYFRTNLPELKKLCPMTGFSVQIDRLQPIPGVYDWDYLEHIFDLAAAQGMTVLPYLAEKWPASWQPIEFLTAPDGSVHRGSTMWGFMVGKYNYCAGAHGPATLAEFNRQLARRFLNHPGFAGPYFENEHFTDYFASHDAGNRAAFAEFLQKRYAGIAALNERWGTDYADFAAVELPEPNPGRFPRLAAQADFSQYQDERLSRFVRESQFDAYRAEDPRRPIMMYNLGQADYDLHRHIADNGGMMANGGVHATVDSLRHRAIYACVPSLQERMEPHLMWEYEPFPHGFDEMITGMLGLAGRGLHFHFFLPNRKFDYAQYAAPEFSLTNGRGRVGYNLIQAHLPALRELRQTESVFDPVGIMYLRNAREALRGTYYAEFRPILFGLWTGAHYLPRLRVSGADNHYLDGSRVIFALGEVADRAETDYLESFVRSGGTLVLEEQSGRFAYEDPDSGAENALLLRLGLDPLAAGQTLDGVTGPHSVYPLDAGRVIYLRRRLIGEQYREILGPILAGTPPPLLAADDPQLQLYLLRHGQAYYLAASHSVGGHDQIEKSDWAGKIAFRGGEAQRRYRVQDIWSGGPESLLTGAELAAGFDAGSFVNKQLKIFKIAPAE